MKKTLRGFALLLLCVKLVAANVTVKTRAQASRWQPANGSRKSHGARRKGEKQ